MSFLNSCRFCLKFITESNRIQLGNEIKQQFKELTNTELLISSLYPEFGCQNCLDLLESCLKKRNEFIETQNYLYENCRKNSNREKQRAENIEEEIVPEFKLEQNLFEDLDDLYIKTEKEAEEENSVTLKKEPNSDIENSNIITCIEQPGSSGSKQWKHNENPIDITKTRMPKRNVICDVCSKVFASKTQIKNHLKMHFKIRENPCPECGKMYVRMSTLKLHLKTMHGSDNKDVESMVCVACIQGKTLCKKHLAKHLKTKREHEAKPDAKIPCPHCMSIVRAGGLKSHIAAVHLKIKNFFCDCCGLGFFYKTAIRNHLKKHFKIRDIQCPECGKFYVRKSSVREHIKAVHRKIKKYIPPTTCELCGKVFSNKALYEHHKRAKHTGERRYACDFEGCNKRFFGHNELHVHKKLTHSEPQECTICHIFTRNIKYHMKRYHEEKKFVCDFQDNGVVCGKRFEINSMLKKHIDTSHRGIKAYCCKDCGNNFSTHSSLANHRRNVHEKRRIKCELCSVLVTKKDYYRRHVILHHKELDEETKNAFLEKIKKTPVEVLFNHLS